MFLDEARARLREECPVDDSEVKPCTEAEVKTLEAKLGHVLPTAYREYLLWMGHGAGSFLRGSDAFYGDLPKLRLYSTELLREDGVTWDLPSDAFVFYVHQGYQFMYFRLSEGEDPPVYWYSEAEVDRSIKVLYPSFSQFVLKQIEGHKTLLDEIKRIS